MLHLIYNDPFVKLCQKSFGIETNHLPQIRIFHREIRNVMKYVTQERRLTRLTWTRQCYHRKVFCRFFDSSRYCALDIFFCHRM